ncbi:lytic transglycosylase domain-containing protein [Shimia haliotis]
MGFRAVWGGLAMLCALVIPLQAESPPPFPDFSAKRVTPPKPGQSKRITVQITPTTPETVGVVASIPTPEAGAQVVPLGIYGWFWSAISPDVGDAGPGRLEPALVAIGNAPAEARVKTPRLDELRATIEAYGTDILLATIGTQVSPALALAVIAVESGGRSDAVSSAGAQGLMQLMPATAERFGVDDPLVAKDNIGGGVRFLDFLMTEFDRDPILVLAGYNAGENSIPAHDGVPPFAETRDYVPKVLAAFQVAKALCVTPPELITDGCVFARH